MGLDGIDLLDPSQVKYAELYLYYVCAHRPFVLDSTTTASWSAATEWVTPHGSVNYNALSALFGADLVPVQTSDSPAQCKQILFAHYLHLLQTNTTTDYLKDWHFDRAHAEHQAYAANECFQPDWIDECASLPDSTNPFGGDYRFLYLGPEGSRTGLHADVLASHSWSANVTGKKLWYFIPPGNESYFYEQSTVGTSQNTLINDLRDRSDLFETAGVIQLVQTRGQVVFVPCAWHHQVHNLEPSLSINRNWANASNARELCEFVTDRSRLAEKEIEHLRGQLSADEFNKAVQAMTKADGRLSMCDCMDWLGHIHCARLKQTVNTIDYSALFKCDIHSNHVLDCLKQEKCRSKLYRILLTDCECTSILQPTCDSCQCKTWQIDSIVCEQLMAELKVPY